MSKRYVVRELAYGNLSRIAGFDTPEEASDCVCHWQGMLSDAHRGEYSIRISEELALTPDQLEQVRKLKNLLQYLHGKVSDIQAAGTVRAFQEVYDDNKDDFDELLHSAEGLGESIPEKGICLECRCACEKTEELCIFCQDELSEEERQDHDNIL